MRKLLTAGAYGWDEDSFKAAIRDAHPDVFVDVRRRRGLRGSKYAFANSRRLQEILADLAIPYVHRLEVAPSDETRSIVSRQAAADGIGYRDRNSVSPEYVDAYRRDALDGFDSDEFVASLGPDVDSALLFCVEGTPHACHRSILARRLSDDLGIPVEHIVPPSEASSLRD